MTSKLKDELVVDQVFLSRKRVMAEEFLNGHSLASLELEEIRDIVIDNVLLKLRTEILAEEEPKELYVAVFKIPKNWWETLKEEKFPKSLLNYFPS